MTKVLTLSEEMGVSNEEAVKLLDAWLLPDPRTRYSTPSEFLTTIAKANLTLNEKLLLVFWMGRIVSGNV